MSYATFRRLPTITGPEDVPRVAADIQSNFDTLRGIVTPQGVLLPNLTTTARNAIVNPQAGLLIFNSTTLKLNFWDGAAWQVS